MVGGILWGARGRVDAECHGGDLYFSEYARQRNHPVSGSWSCAGVVQCRSHRIRFSSGVQHLTLGRLSCRRGRHPDGSRANQALEYLCGSFSRGWHHFVWTRANRLGLGSIERSGMVYGGAGDGTGIAGDVFCDRICRFGAASIEYGRGDGGHHFGARWRAGGLRGYAADLWGELGCHPAANVFGVWTEWIFDSYCSDGGSVLCLWRSPDDGAVFCRKSRNTSCFSAGRADRRRNSYSTGNGVFTVQSHSCNCLHSASSAL